MTRQNQLPVASDSQAITLSDGAVIHLRRYGTPEGPRLALSHGNGLAIDGYAVFWERLCSDYDLVLFDMRNHGQNPVHSQAAHHWGRMIEDIGEIRGAIDRVFGAKPTTGVFHSMSAVASLMYATAPDHASAINPSSEGDGASQPRGFDRLVLFDPPIFPPQDHKHHAAALQATRSLTELTLRRSTHYGDPADLARQFQRKAIFNRWIDGVANDLARATLVQRDDLPQWQLACPREFEAHMFQTNTDPELWWRLCQPIQVPVRIVGADPSLPGQGAPALVCAALAQTVPDTSTLEYGFVPDTTHFLQLEKPDLCVAQVSEFLRSFDE